MNLSIRCDTFKKLADILIFNFKSLILDMSEKSVDNLKGVRNWSKKT